MNLSQKQDFINQWHIFTRIVGYIRPYSRQLILGILASVVTGIFGFSPAIMLKYLFDLIIPTGKLEYLYSFCVLIVGIYLIKGFTQYAQSYLMDRVGQHVIFDIRSQVFDHLLSLSLGYYQKRKSGELISMIISDVSLMELAVSRVMGQLVLKSFALFPPLIAVFYISWKLAFLALIGLPVLLYPIVKFAQRLRRVSTKGQEQMANLTSTMSESFYGMQVIKAYNMEDFKRKRFGVFNREYYKELLKAARVNALSTPLMELIGALSAAIIFAFGLRMVIYGTLSQGNLLAFLASLFIMYNPVKVLSKLNYDIQRALAGAERVFSVLDSTNPIREKPDPVMLEHVTGKISFEGVSFEYNEGEPVLQQINLDIMPGETLALVGVSGVGKSTMVSLIPRFYDPTDGKITIDGLDLRVLSLTSLRDNIGMVTQETILFNDTIYNNITYGRSDFNSEQIEKACRAAYSYDFIQEMPNGLETVIGERGTSLSGGQRQRLAITRALLKNPPILILDEATSSLDAESEALIQKALNTLIRNRTTIIIAHRLSTVRNASRIAVMHHGQIVELGTHEELFNRSGAYRNLYDLQFLNSHS
ncbi:ABC transporter ATP-binding protein [bacterium]|nr:ABC transporter ATP-binding protein [candidate division CSSED10-310 bacterium]